MNIQIFSYEEVINILQHEQNLQHNLIWNWFGDLEEDSKDEEGNYQIAFSEDCIEVQPDDFFMIDHTTDSAMVLHSINDLTSDVRKLIKLGMEEI